MAFAQRAGRRAGAWAGFDEYPGCHVDGTLSLACFGTAVAGAGCLFRRYRPLRGSTLTAPLGWGVFSLLVLGLGELFLGVGGQTVAPASHVRYLTAVSTMCPLMAVLGAKRPQDRGWQFVVVTLAAVLAFPCLVALSFRSDTPLRLDAIWQWCLAILLGMGLLNNLPTRYGPSALLAVAGQVLLLWGQLPLLDDVLPGLASHTGGRLAGIGMLTAAAAAWSWEWPRPQRPAAGIDRLWLDFRDGFGAVWALRVLGRFNASAEMYGWQVELQWRGLSGDPPSAEVEAAMRKALSGLLRRFVPPEWIAERLG